MKKIELLNRDSATHLQQACLAALEGVAKEYGVSIKAAGGSLAETELTLKFKVSVKSVAAAATREKVERSNLELLGLSPDALGRTFKSRGTEYRLVSTHPDRPKYPITGARVPDGKLFKFTIEAVKNVGMIAP